jgi:hypothetical protein
MFLMVLNCAFQFFKQSVFVSPLGTYRIFLRFMLPPVVVALIDVLLRENDVEGSGRVLFG